MGPFNVVLGCLLGSILGFATLSFLGFITSVMIRRKPRDPEKEPYYWKKELPARPTSTQVRGPPRIPVANPRRIPIQQPIPHHQQQYIPDHIQLPPLLHTIDPPRPSRPSSAQQTLNGLPRSVAQRISTQIDGKMGISVNRGTIITSRPSIESPRPAPPIPPAARPYTKPPLEHTRHVSQPSLHPPRAPSLHPTVSGQPSLDPDTLPHTLLLDSRPHELPETHEPHRRSQISRLFSLFQRHRSSKVPNKSDERLEPHSSKSNSDDSLLAAPKFTPPPQLPQFSPLDLKGLDVSFSNFQLSEPEPISVPVQPAPEVWRPEGTEAAPAPLVTRSTEYTNTHESDFDFLNSSEKRGSERWSTASSRFSGQRVVLSATLENLREQYLGSGLNLSYHSKAEYERLAGIVTGSNEDLALSDSEITASTLDSSSTLRLAPPLQIPSDPSSPVSIGTPGAYEIRPLSISKVSQL